MSLLKYKDAEDVSGSKLNQFRDRFFLVFPLMSSIPTTPGDAIRACAASSLDMVPAARQQDKRHGISRSPHARSCRIPRVRSILASVGAIRSRQRGTLTRLAAAAWSAPCPTPKWPVFAPPNVRILFRRCQFPAYEGWPWQWRGAEAPQGASQRHAEGSATQKKENEG